MTAKRVCLYGILCGLCLVLGYLESLVSLSFIAPGIKLGLSNSVALLLILNKDIKGAFAVNLTRIVLSGLLFGAPFALIFSLCGGIASTTLMALLTKWRAAGPIGFSVAGGATHNLFQLIAAIFVVGRGAVYYLPVLLVSGAVSGALIGVLSVIVLKKLQTNRYF